MAARRKIQCSLTTLSGRRSTSACDGRSQSTTATRFPTINPRSVSPLIGSRRTEVDPHHLRISEGLQVAASRALLSLARFIGGAAGHAGGPRWPCRVCDRTRTNLRLPQCRCSAKASYGKRLLGTHDRSETALSNVDLGEPIARHVSVRLITGSWACEWTRAWSALFSISPPLSFRAVEVFAENPAAGSAISYFDNTRDARGVRSTNQSFMHSTSFGKTANKCGNQDRPS